MATLTDRRGDRHGRLVVVERAESRAGRTLWRCRCDCGAIVEVDASSLASGLTKSCGCLRAEVLAAGRATRRQADPGYLPVHKRLTRARGRAAEHACVDCGEPAEHWSYDGTDPDERQGLVIVRGRTYTVTYSLDPTHYAPRCARCHKKFDHHETRSTA